MTRDPITVESDATLVQSLSIMFEHEFRHLPIQQNGKVVGVLSCRDIPAGYWIKWENWLAAQNELKSSDGLKRVLVEESVVETGTSALC